MAAPMKSETVLEVGIIGCGNTGGLVARGLAKWKFAELSLYDFDFVDASNLATQEFSDHQIGYHKSRALATNLNARGSYPRIDHYTSEFLGFQSPSARTTIDGYHDVTGILFCCIDNVQGRERIAGYLYDWEDHLSRLLFVDIRMFLETARIYTLQNPTSQDLDAYRASLPAPGQEAPQGCDVTPLSSSMVACGLALEAANRWYKYHLVPPRDLLYSFLDTPNVTIVG